MSASQIHAGIAAAGGLTVGGLFRQQVRLDGGRMALEAGGRRFTYAALNERVNRLAHTLSGLGITRGERIAILAENRLEYLELELAAAKLGAIVACQNWRQSDAELAYCITLAEPELALVSERYAATLARLDLAVPRTLVLGRDYEAALARASAAELPEVAEPEDGLIILYTSGTTGLPKGALISHRAMVARSMVSLIDGGLFPERTFVAWAPCFHMVSTDHLLAAMMHGGKAIILDGFDPAGLVEIVAREAIGWLQLMPATVGRMIAELKSAGIRPKGVAVTGAMADLVPRHEIAEITTLLQAPFRNTFGSTETGSAPGSRGLIPVGVVPERLSKRQSSFCAIRLVDADDREVANGEPGEVAFRGPTLFSGYWRAPEANAEDFRGGWFHMGDLLRRNADGSLDFVDRRKYLIKSGGENIYPAEIERVLLASPRIADAVVVRRADPRWGEVPVAFVVRRDPALTADEVVALCRGQIAGYKLPKAVRFITDAELPRSTTGKVKRHDLEALLKEPPAADAT